MGTQHNKNKHAIFDIDGVLACNKRRAKHIKCEQPDWDAFYEDMANDPPLEPGMKLARSLIKVGVRLFMLTGRPEAYRLDTWDWMERHGLTPSTLLMREGGSTIDHKRYYAQVISERFELLFAVEDDPRCCSIYEELGIPHIYVHSGYYDEGEVCDVEFVNGMSS